MLAKKITSNKKTVLQSNYLRTMSKTFERAWNMALSGDYWNAMILNGVAASATLNTDPGLVGKMIGAGALGASVSGNARLFAVYRNCNYTTLQLWKLSIARSFFLAMAANA